MQGFPLPSSQAQRLPPRKAPNSLALRHKGTKAGRASTGHAGSEQRVEAGIPAAPVFEQTSACMHGVEGGLTFKLLTFKPLTFKPCSPLVRLWRYVFFTYNAQVP
eukprot:365370-Chlamydomonas_euryale.AAC.15